MKLQISLEYTIPEGALGPYFDALRRGDALASTCQNCGRVAFPARTICASCKSDAFEWTALSGIAHIMHRSDGINSTVALARFEGADTLTTVALTNPDSRAETGKLSTPVGDRPGLWLKLVKTT